jgi:dGTPase
MINTVVTDLIEATKRNLDETAPQSIDDVRAAGRPLVGFSADIGEQHRLLKQFLHQHLYSHERKLEMTRKVQTVLRDLFDTFMNDIDRMPGEFAGRAAEGDETARARVVADYIAGMTDRYAFAEHKRISG